MLAKLTIAVIGNVDQDLSKLFYQVKQQQFTGDLVIYPNPYNLLVATMEDIEARVPALVILYYRTDAGLAPGHFRQLRALAPLAYVPVVVCAGTIDARTEQELEELEVYATLHTPADGSWAAHAEAFVHMCYFWHQQLPEYEALRKRHNY